MKANSSGNRVTGGPAHFPSTHGRAPDDAVSGLPDEERRAQDRELFVSHQQQLARRALHLGSPGAARAALRALYAVDFEDTKEAMEHLGMLRDPTAPPDEVMLAMRALVLLAPAGSTRPRTTTEQFFPLVRDIGPRSDDGDE